MEYTDREKKAMADVDKLSFLLDDVYSTGLVDDEERDEYVKSIQMVLDLLEKKNKELEMYKRIVEMNLKDGEEFKNEMCKHRCILKSDLEENYISKDRIRKNIKELNDNRPYLSKFDDWKEKEYTNEDVTNKCVEILEDLLGDE